MGPVGLGGKVGAALLLGCDAGGGGGRGLSFFISGPKKQNAHLLLSYFYLSMPYRKTYPISQSLIK